MDQRIYTEEDKTSVPENTERSEEWHSEIADLDLKDHFPRSKRSVIRNWFPYFGGFVIAFLLGSAGLISVDNLTLSPHIRGFFTAICEKFISLAFLIAVGGLIYEVLFYLTYEYRISKGAIITRWGVIWRNGGSMPLHGVSDIELKKNFGDFIFGLERLQFTTSSPNAAGVVVDGLSADVAGRLRDSVLEMAGKLTGAGQQEDQPHAKEEPHHQEASNEESQKEEHRTDQKSPGTGATEIRRIEERIDRLEQLL